MRTLLLMSLAAALVVACVAPGRGNGTGGRYVDPYTCAIKNPREGDPPYDPDCIKAAQAAADAAAKAASRKK